MTEWVLMKENLMNSIQQEYRQSRNRAASIFFDGIQHPSGLLCCHPPPPTAEQFSLKLWGSCFNFTQQCDIVRVPQYPHDVRITFPPTGFSFTQSVNIHPVSRQRTSDGSDDND